MLHIVTDSMSDYQHISDRDPSVVVVSQPVRFGLEEFMDNGVELPREVFFQRMRTSSELPKTSMVSRQSWLDAFPSLLAQPEDTVLCICGSSKLSGGFQAAVLAAESCHAPDRIRVVDSLSASCGEVLLIRRALERRQQGGSLEEVASAVADASCHLHVVGLADDLKYLVMGGRLSPLVGQVGSALNIKPMLRLAEGVIAKAGAVRGLKKGYAWFADQLKLHVPQPGSIVYVGGADCPDATQTVRSVIADAGVVAQTRHADVGCVIGAHAGPGLVLVAWLSE